MRDSLVPNKRVRDYNTNAQLEIKGRLALAELGGTLEPRTGRVWLYFQTFLKKAGTLVPGEVCDSRYLAHFPKICPLCNINANARPARKSLISSTISCACKDLFDRPVSLGVPLNRSKSHSMQAPTPNRRLESWKEIASYLRRTVRTVQRWEAAEGLPVHRHVHPPLIPSLDSAAAPI
jgi:hypothetical protein